MPQSRERAVIILEIGANELWDTQERGPKPTRRVTVSVSGSYSRFFPQHRPLFPTNPLGPPRYELYTAIKGPFGTTKNLHPFPEIDVTERFPDDWEASAPAGLCTGDNSALLEFRAPRHDFWGGSGDLELLTVDGSLLDGVIAVEEVKLASRERY